MLQQRRSLLAATSAASLLVSAAVAADGIRIAATADAEGELEPVRTAAVSGEPRGGIARRAHAVAGMRQAEPMLLVDAGNFLPVEAELASRGRLVLAAYARLGYDAVNLSFFDLRRGARAVLELLPGANVDVVSANLVDERTGEPLAKPFVVKQVGSRPVAVIGLTEAPPGLEFLPHVRAAAAGVRVLPAIETLRKLLPQAQARARDVVLLYHGPAAGLERILAAHALELAAVVHGNVRDEPPPTSPPAILLAPARRGAAVELASAGSVTRLQLGDAVPEDAALASWVLAQDPRVALDRARGGSPPAWKPGAAGLQSIGRSGENRGARVSVLTAELAASRGALQAPPGRRLLVLETEWENLIPLTRIKDRETPTEYRIPNLGDHLYLVVNGARLERLPRNAVSLPGHVPATPLRLERLGSRATGCVVFAIPATNVESLELRLYDFAHGHIVMPLTAGAPADPTPVLASASESEVLDVAVYALELPATSPGIGPQPGLQLLRLDLRAQSKLTIEGEAAAFDPRAAPGERLQVGTVADWKEWRRYVQVVADGEVASTPLAGSTLADEPRFLPDLMTGGDVFFLVPENLRSLELRCDFPNARSSLDGAEFRPRGVTLALKGERAGPAPVVAIQRIDDDVFGVAITSQRLAADLPGATAGTQERLWILGITVENRGQKGELFQTRDQILRVDPGGRKSRFDPALQRTPRRPVDVLWIPAGERRSFDVVFRAGATEKTLRLEYAGVSLARILEFPAPEFPAVAEGAAPPPAPAPPPVPEPAAAPAPPRQAERPAAVVKPASPPAVRPGKAAQPEATADILKPPAEPRGLAGVGLTAEQVNRAIDRGADFLWGYLKEKDFKDRRLDFGGDNEHVLCALALVHAGAHSRIPELDFRLRGFLAKLDPRSLQIYPAGILSMLVEAYGDPSFLQTLRTAVRYTLEVQGDAGSWTYSRPLPDGFFKDDAPARALVVSGGTPLDGSEVPKPLVRASPWKDGVNGDNSVSQYALLGLHAASRSGVKIAPEVWTRALASYQSRQCGDGGWAYHGKTPAGYGSMTCAGICSIAIARHELGEKEPAADPAIWQGLAWLDRNFSVAVHPGINPPEHWRYYYLYSLERVGRVLGLEFIGRHEWYPLGAKHLLDTQQADGAWIGKLEEQDPRLATSFALLFLTRATPQLEAQLARRGGHGTLKTGVQMPPGRRYYFILDASGSMTAALDGESKWEIARNAVSRLIDELPDSAEAALRVYGHRKRAIEDGASEDTALEVPLRRLDRKVFQAKLAALRPRGKTPLALSLREAAKDLQGAATSGEVDVILLTDGGEDTLPRQDPVAAAAELGKLRGIDLRVVGFDIGRQDWSDQLQAMVRAARGAYWPAKKAAALLVDLRAAVFGVPDSYVVVDAQDNEAGRGPFGGSLRLAEGKYKLRTAFAGQSFDADFWINTDAATSVVFNAERVLAQGAAGGAEGGLGPSPAPPAPAAAPKFCSACGAALKAAANFCAGCGARVRK